MSGVIVILSGMALQLFFPDLIRKAQLFSACLPFFATPERGFALHKTIISFVIDLSSCNAES